jgi:hypothetical protein
MIGTCVCARAGVGIRVLMGTSTPLCKGACVFILGSTVGTTSNRGVVGIDMFGDGIG